MADSLKLCVAQLDPVVGDLPGNADRLLTVRAESGRGTDLIVAPELYLSGYPPEDLVMRRGFQAAVADQAARIAAATADNGPWILIGAPWVVDGALYNAALLLGDGAIQAVCRKSELPNYGVFDEKRVFAPGPPPQPVSVRGVRIGVLICEDMWTPAPAVAARAAGAELLVAINGSPFEADKIARRTAQATARVRETDLPLVYVNQTGGQDELVFDGSSFAMDAGGAIVVQAASWVECAAEVRLVRTDAGLRPESGPVAPAPGELEMTYRALVHGLRDYTEKNGFHGVVVGLSGGVDSALSAGIAVDALGAANVRCVALPSVYTSRESMVDAAECAALLGTSLESLPIQQSVDAFLGLLHTTFAGAEPDTTEENLQARVRAVILMALSNKFGHMLLTTGNKSEMSVGYTTLYGDMSGGFSVLKDVYKTRVYELARWRNAYVPAGGRGPNGPILPDSVLHKAPTAELRPNQTDQDSLPPYDQLDAILHALVDEERAVDDVIRAGHPAALVARIENLIYGAEYKRRQAPPGVRISRRNFGRDRRYPITNRFREGSRGDGADE